MPDELRPMTAGRLLTVWRNSREAAEEPVERALLCNAQVLAECCFKEGEQLFADTDDVLQTLTTREMERLLRLLASDGEAGLPGAENPAFDRQRFEELREG